jgi:hypothetical protein
VPITVPLGHPLRLFSPLQLVVATGKARGPWVSEVLPRLELSMPGVFLQGLLVYDADGSRLFVQCLPDDVARDCIALATALGEHSRRCSWDRLP